MGTSLTPEFWRQFAVLLVIAMTVTFVLSATLDALYLRSRQRRAARRASGPGTTGTTIPGPRQPSGRPLVKS
ncbi:hypothetical protein ABZ848_29830 [Streptomyces sp. NPDC047081]|uniref:hypothetical protein n=1 Tax=Streptomyces sp. NPDC047081 TaxID=3154706 RepID=UPI00340E09AA